MSSLKSLLFDHGWMYTKRGGVAACHIVWIGLCLRSVPGVRVLASAVDDSSTALARTRTLECSSSITQYKQHDMLPHHHS